MSLLNIRKNPELKKYINGRKIIGRGAFSIVVDNGDETVSKITICPHARMTNFDCCIKLSTEYAPIVFGDYETLQEDFIEIERKTKTVSFDLIEFKMERLYKVKSKESKKLINAIQAALTKAWAKDENEHKNLQYRAMLEIQAQHMSDEIFSEFWQSVIDYYINVDDIKTDMHTGNVMQRQDGQLVFTDIFCSCILLARLFQKN